MRISIFHLSSIHVRAFCILIWMLASFGSVKVRAEFYVSGHFGFTQYAFQEVDEYSFLSPSGKIFGLSVGNRFEDGFYAELMVRSTSMESEFTYLDTEYKYELKDFYWGPMIRKTAWVPFFLLQTGILFHNLTPTVNDAITKKEQTDDDLVKVIFDHADGSDVGLLFGLGVQFSPLEYLDLTSDFYMHVVGVGVLYEANIGVRYIF